jgi:hypothetical protein
MCARLAGVSRGMGVAGLGPGAPAFSCRRRPLRGGTAPRDRDRCGGGGGRARAGRRRRLVLRDGPGRRADRHAADRGRLFGDASPPRAGCSSRGHTCGGRRSSGDGRAQRASRAARPVCVSRGSADGRAARLPRPADPASASPGAGFRAGSGPGAESREYRASTRSPGGAAASSASSERCSAEAAERKCRAEIATRHASQHAPGGVQGRREAVRRDRSEGTCTRDSPPRPAALGAHCSSRSPGSGRCVLAASVCPSSDGTARLRRAQRSPRIDVAANPSGGAGAARERSSAPVALRSRGRGARALRARRGLLATAHSDLGSERVRAKSPP